ncbi:MAG: hypothetical protein ACRDP1_14305 [Nocardioidaceae bacterium]
MRAARMIAGLTAAVLLGGVSSCSKAQILVTARPTGPGVNPAGGVFPPPGEPAGRLRKMAMGMLAARSKALLSGDKAAFTAQLDTTDAGFARSQQVLFDNVQKLPFADFHYRFDTTFRGTSTRRYSVPTYVVGVRVEHRFAGFDQRDSAEAVAFTFVHDPAGWRIASDTDVDPALMGGALTDPWDLGPLSVARSTHLLILGDADAPSVVARTQAQIRRSIAYIDSTLGVAWSHRVVAYVGRNPATLTPFAVTNLKVAAITAPLFTGVSGDPHRRLAGLRVLVNARYGEDDPTVLTHELTHVVLWPLATGVPTWLVEGTAE